MSTMANQKISIEDHLSLSQLVNSSPALLHTARPDGYLDFFNQTWLDFTGETMEKLLGWEWASFIHPDDVDSFVQRMRDSFAKGDPFQETSRVRRADGTYRWMLHQKIPAFASDGKIIKWYGSSVDIDDRVRAEEEVERSAQELQRSEFYLAEAQRLGHIGSWVFNPTGSFDYWSRELFRIYGLDGTGNAPTLEEYLACVHPHDREFMASLIQQMLAEGLGCDVTKRIVRHGGEVRHIRCVGVPVVENGVLKRIVGNAIDVTEHEFLIRELERREAYLTEAQSLSRTGSFGWKPDRALMFWSAETYRIFEIDPSAQLTLSVIMSRVHPEDRDLVRETMESAWRNATTIDFEHRLAFPDERVKYVRILARPLQIDSDGVEFAGAVIDVTEARCAEDHLRYMRMKLTRASRIATVAELSASIAHELNQPLMSLLANAQAAKRWLSFTPPSITEVNLSIDRIIRDARAADETMQHIRALFKQESFDKKEADIADLVREVVRFVLEDPRKREVPIEFRFEEALPVVSIDQIQMQQLFINLIVNAIEAVEGHATQPLVRVRAYAKHSSEILVEVIDNGPGVNDPERVFDAFTTTKEKGMG